MKMKKLFAGLVATSMVAAMGTSAMAEDVDFTLTPNYAEAGTVTVAEAADLATTYEGDQMTVLIFKSDESDNPTASDENIVYINQDVAGAALFTDMGVKDNSEDETIVLEAGTYIVRIGGADIINNGIYQGTFTVSYEPDAPDTPVYTLGDVNADGDILLNDATTVLQKVANIAELTDTQMLAADVTKDGDVLLNDATTILQKIANIIENF